MKIVIVVATAKEVEPLLNKLNVIIDAKNKINCFTFLSHSITLLITEIGMVSTTYHLSKLLTSTTFDFALNIGICGSFNTHLSIGTVIHIIEDTFAELGAEDGEQFLTLNQLGFIDATKITNSNSKTISTVLTRLPKVNGITVNTTHGNETSIEKVCSIFHPTTESMEGAAFMYVCENEKIKYAQVRGVSNFVELRNKNKWNIPLAIENVNNTVFEILQSL